MKFTIITEEDENETDTIIAGHMTAEQTAVAHDLVNHTLNKMSTMIRDHISLSEHPAQTYIMLVQAAKLILNGFALYHPVAGLDKHGQAPEPNHKLDRIRYSTAIAFLMIADDQGAKGARHVLKRTLRENIDSRELMRFVAGMKFD